MLVIVSKYILPLVQLLNFFPGAKRILGGLAVFVVGALAVWNQAVTGAELPQLAFELPAWIKDVLVAILGVGVAAGVVNDRPVAGGVVNDKPKA